MSWSSPPEDEGTVASAHRAEVAAGRRFEFGKNWRRLLEVVDEGRISIAEASLTAMLGEPDLAGKSFLDIGSGSGLFSLAAHRLGAAVCSFDFDPEAVACTREIKARFAGDDADWEILEGSVLDRTFVESLGLFDVVYSWGVLHHSGDMWRGLEHAALPVAPEGVLFIALYNDQGMRSVAWRWIKQIYCSGRLGRAVTGAIYFPSVAGALALNDLVRLRLPTRRYTEYRQRRGMSMMRDWVDWLGGYPFEVATPDAVVEHYRLRGFEVERLVTTRALGNNQFVFRRRANEGR